MATILENQRSDVGSPYVYYSVNATEVENSRTPDEVEIYLQIQSRLGSAGSSLGTGKALRSRIYFFDGENDMGETDIPMQAFDIDLKSNNDIWNGTTPHTETKTIKLTNLPSSLTTIKNIKFRVWRTDNSGESGNMSAKDCNDLTITMGHLIPSNVNYTIEEVNPLLVSANVSDNLIIENLSKKKFTLSYELHDETTMQNVGIVNNNVSYLSNSNPFVLDLSNITLEKNVNDNTKIPIKGAIKDSLNSFGYSLINNYSYITYTPISIVESITTVKRNGQTSGKVILNVNGLFFNSSIGNINQRNIYSETEDTKFLQDKDYYMLDNGEYILLESGVDYNIGDNIEGYFTTIYELALYKPTVKYKFWLATDSEPLTYNYTIPNEYVNILNNEFSITNYEIGSATETDPNYFNPNNVYKVKVYVEDNFTSKESIEKQINKGIRIWSEYVDKVDFLKITRDKENIVDFEVGDTFEIEAGTTGGMYVGGTITNSARSLHWSITLPKSLKKINSISVSNLVLTIRHIGGGYIYDEVSSVDGTLEIIKLNDYIIDFYNYRTSSTGTTNNTPIAVAFSCTLTFN